MIDLPGEDFQNSASDLEDPAQVTVGIITAITVETVAVKKVLDRVVTVEIPGDRHPYHIGTLPSRLSSRPHVVAVAQQTSDGTRNAAWLCGHMPHAFGNLRAIAMCGIAGGVPPAEAVKGVDLGDIVVATEVVDYRHERQVDGSSTVRAMVRPPGTVWMNADHEVEADELEGAPPWLPGLHAGGSGSRFARPGQAGLPRAHRGRVGSADLLLRDAVLRGDLARRHRILAFEMEGAGIAIGSHLGDLPWYMVRGIADHGDNATKNDAWHPYAALAAASYLRSVLARCSPFGTRQRQPAGRQRRQPSRLDHLNVIVDALAALRIMHDDMQRRAVLNQLPPAIRSQIPESATGRIHLIETVTVLRGPEGLEALLTVLGRTLGPRSAEFVEIEGVLRDNWPGL